VEGCIKYGILATVIVTGVIAVLFECLADPLAMLFALASGEGGEQIKNVVVVAIRIAAIGYVFMGISVAIQGVLQALRYSIYPLVISFLRLCVIVFPVAYLFTLSDNAVNILWWTFPIAEVVTAAVSLIFLKIAGSRKVATMPATRVTAGVEAETLEPATQQA
jgi:Na+-driven multidrug efflux pump